MKILVTGAAGFIGMHVARRLLEDGHQVVGIDNLNDYYDVQLKIDRLAQIDSADGFTFEKLDIADRSGVETLFEQHDFERVIHLAAQAGVRYSLENPHAYVDSNLVGFVNVLEGCRHGNVSHLVYASSSSVYGANEKIPFSVGDRVDTPVSLYAATKKANELMAHTYSHLYGLNATGLRFFTVYGPWGRPDMAYFSFVKAIVDGEPIRVFNHGRMRRDFTYVDDIVEGVVRVADQLSGAEPPHVIYNIGNHTPVDLERFISIIEHELGMSAEKVYLPMQPGDVPQTFADVSDLMADVGFAPSTTLEEGIGRFVRWYRDYYGVGSRTE